MADKVSLGRVQGVSIFYTSSYCSTSTTNIDTSSIIPNDITVFVGDKVIDGVGQLYSVTSISGTTLKVTYLTTLKGADGTSFTIAYQVDSVDDLPTPEPDLMGEAWAVGTESPHLIYVVAINTATLECYWLNLGQLQGPDGVAATISVGDVETLEPGSKVTVVNSGNNRDAVFDFGIPQGAKGDAATIDSVSATTLEPGADATVQNTGNSSNASFVFGIPQGEKGDTGTIESVSATTLDPGSSATVANNGTKTAADLAFGIPRGDKGETGATPAISMSASVDQTIGTATVAVSKTGSNESPSFAIAFSGIKGEKGETGNTPNITMSADVDQTIGTATVGVSKGGDADNPTFAIAFSGIKGEKGETGLTPNISASATVDQSVGTAQVTVTPGGTAEDPTLAFAFTGIKGVGVTGANLSDENDLTFTLSDGSTIEAGKVVPATSIYVAFIRDSSTGQIAYFGGFYNGVATVNHIMYQITGEREVGIYGVDDESITDITFPEEVEIYNLTNYGGNSEDGVFRVTSICDKAFQSCTFVTSVTLTDSITSIGDYAFEGTSISKITFTSAVTSIGQCAFRSTLITTLTLPETISSIGQGAFSNCGKLNTIYYYCANATCRGGSSRGGILYYYNGTENNYGSNLKVYLESSVRTLGDYMFCHSGTAMALYMADGITSIGNYAFYESTPTSPHYSDYFGTTFTFPNTLLTIGNYAFAGVGWWVNIDLGDSVTTIGDYAFYRCLNPDADLEYSNKIPSTMSLTIGKSVASIGAYCFYYLTLPQKEFSLYINTSNSLYIEQYAFNSLSRVYDAENSAIDVYYVGSSSDRDDKITIHNISYNGVIQNGTWHYNYK